MKKSLLALAVLGAFAGAASAQSSVTLFGTVDLNGQWINNGGLKQYRMGQNGLASSAIGFRGTEDLGGGLNASFWLEASINPDTGDAFNGSPGGDNGLAFKRRSTVSLSGNWGEVRLGRDYTSTFWNSTVFDPFGTNGVGSAGNLAFVNPTIPTGGAYNTIVRANNMIGYFIPSGIAGGLYGQVQVAAGENAPGNKYYGGRLGYAAGPFNVAGAWGRTEVTNDQNATQWNIGGSWNFGFLTASGYYGQIKLADLEQNNWYIGASAPIGLFTLKASYGQVDRGGSEPFAPGFDNQHADQFAFGAVYDLSKRTAFYATYSYLKNKDGAQFVIQGLSNQPNGGATPNGNSQGAEVGIKHSF